MISQNKDPLEGKRISQRFRIKTVEKWQEHAVFCCGEDLEKNRQVSLILIDALALKSAEQFEKAAQRKERLRCPALVSVEGWGQTSEGECFLALDLIGLDEIEHFLNAKKAFSIHQSVEIISRLIEALSFLAEHRETAVLPFPNQVFIHESDSASVKLLDLNYADTLVENDLLMRSRLSAIQKTIYTPPECIKEKVPDAKSQIYTLGCLLYQLLTGAPPFVSDDLVELQSQQLCVAPKRFHEARPDLYLPPALETCVLKALNKDAAQRQSSLNQFQTELQNAIKRQPWLQRQWKPVACLAALSCALLVYSSGSLVTPFWASTGQTVTTDPPIPVQPTDDPAPTDSSTAMLPPVPANATKLGHLKLSGSEERKLPAGDYLCDDLSLTDSAKLLFNGEAKLWIISDAQSPRLTLSGHSQISSSAEPDKLQIYINGQSPINMSGDTKLKATVLAPGALLDASGNSSIDGVFTSAGQKLSDKAHFIGGPDIN